MFPASRTCFVDYNVVVFVCLFVCLLCFLLFLFFCVSVCGSVSLGVFSCLVDRHCLKW